MEDPRRDNWLVFEDDEGKAAEYADFDEQVEMTPTSEAEHHEYVTRLGAEFEIPMPDWTPTIPSRSRT